MFDINNNPCPIAKSIEFFWENIRQLSGESFFSKSTEIVSLTTKANYVWIGDVSKNKDKITTLSFFQNGVKGSNFEYLIKNSLCCIILEKKDILLVDSSNKNQYFVDSNKENEILNETTEEYMDRFNNYINDFNENSKVNLFFENWTIENYIGVPLFNSKKEVIGVIVVIFSENTEHIAKFKLFMEIISSFCSQELESIEQKRECKYQEQRFYDLFNSTQISIWELDASNIKNDIKDMNLNDFKKSGDFNLEQLDLSSFNIDLVFNIIKKVKITAINNYTLSMFKFESKKEFTTDILSLLSDDFIKKIVLSFNLLKSKTFSHYFESSFKNSLNETLNVSIKWEIPIYSIDSWERIIVVVQDITDKKCYELKAIQSEKMEAVGMLAGGVAHDFNNQLTPIVTFAEILKEELNEQYQIKYIDNILSAATRASDLVDQLLMFSRKGESIFVSLNIDDVIQESIELLERSIDKKITLKHEKNVLMAPIMGDSTMLQNMILNLVINARDAMPNGGEILINTGTITIDTLSLLFNIKDNIQSGDYLKLSITDNGVGIDKTLLNNIFSPFFTTKEPGKGTGLGLSAVYGTVKKHGGFINVESELGVGTTFYIFIPINKVASSKSLEQVSSPKKFPKQNYTVLLVDDEELVYKSTAEILKRVGYSVMICTNGEDAVEYFERYEASIDIIILDIIMPIMSGKEVFSVIRQKNQQIPVIFSSGYPIDSEELLNFGEKVSFIQKPFKISELADKISEFLD